jgi:hypothetical protein
MPGIAQHFEVKTKEICVSQFYCVFLSVCLSISVFSSSLFSISLCDDSLMIDFMLIDTSMPDMVQHFEVRPVEICVLQFYCLSVCLYVSLSLFPPLSVFSSSLSVRFSLR